MTTSPADKPVKSLAEIVQTARHILSDHADNDGACSCAIAANPVTRVYDFPFFHHRTLELVESALRSSGLDPSDLRFEYYPDLNRIRLKMPPTVIHNELINRVSKSIETAVRQTLPDIRCTAGSSVPIISEAGHESQFIPDGGWNLDELDHRPRLVLEVAVSQTRDEVAYKLEEYIIASGHVRAAVGIKVYYNPSNPRAYEDILGNLDQCFVGL